MSSTLIVGAGWLGQPLAHSLLKHNHSVWVTKTSSQGVEEIQLTGLKALELQLPLLPSEQQTFTKLISDSKITTLIGCFPPGFRAGNGDRYARQWASLIRAVQHSSVNKVIMVSSTTVYPDVDSCLTELDASLALASDNACFSDNARVMLKAEQSLIDSGLNYVIIRCAGLFGPQRHPARFVNKLKTVSTVAPANMLHLHDAIGIIEFSHAQLSNQIINAASPTFISKADFYQAAIDSAEDDSLTLPEKSDKAGKQISAQKVSSLGYKFTFESAKKGLFHCR